MSTLLTELRAIVNHPELTTFLSEQAAEVNTALLKGNITKEYRDSIMRDLVVKNIVVTDAPQADIDIFLSRIVKLMIESVCTVG